MKHMTMVGWGMLLLAAAWLYATPIRLCAQQIAETAAIKSPDRSVEKIVAQSQEALGRNDSQLAISVLQQGFSSFPNDENLRVQMARVYVYEKHDQQAMGILNSILLENPASRNARLELAEIYGYRGNYAQSDRLY